MKKLQNQLFTVFVLLIAITASSMIVSAQTYADPTQAETNEWRGKGPCRDPWVSRAVSQAAAYTRYANGYADYAECDPKWYNNGSWSSYDQLYKAVEMAQQSWSKAGYAWRTSFLPDNKAAFYMVERSGGGVVDGVLLKGLVSGGSQQAIIFVSNNGGSLIGNDSAGLVAAGAGNLVAAGGGNLVAAGGGNFSLMNTGKKKIKIGTNTWMIIQ